MARKLALAASCDQLMFHKNMHYDYFMKHASEKFASQDAGGGGDRTRGLLCIASARYLLYKLLAGCCLCMLCIVIASGLWLSQGSFTKWLTLGPTKLESLHGLSMGAVNRPLLAFNCILSCCRSGQHSNGRFIQVQQSSSNSQFVQCMPACIQVHCSLCGTNSSCPIDRSFTTKLLS